ncbi:BatD family protein [Thalassolituus marinus]|uniref:Protein BatD n=1 Tax=Thalassolituus marinus TaxID=671053 RepID=A0ABS7ZT60_9GAMM|nr:BatD family protein [Thalassolituus marinus]MCA6064428.1 protein BatD [Thalassolituus marinus]
MVKPLLTGVLAALLSLQVLAADFVATIDRKQVSEGDTLTLSLRYGEQVGFGSPDLTPLQKDFQVLNQQRSNQFRSVNGNTESFTEWVLTLTPRRTGQLTIPAIRFDGEATDPIQLSVVALSDDIKAQQQKQFFFDTRVQQQDHYYVQGEILYTEKLYYSVNHDNATLSDFEVTDARVEPLGEIQRYTTVIDGVRFGVYERNYAIYPEVSGELVIPGARFNASVVNPYDRWSRGRQASAVSQPLRLNIEPIPASYPQSPWLPARKVTLSETFSTPPEQWREGEPVTRTLTLNADGLPGSQLPAIAMPVIDGIRYYPDQTQQQQSVDLDGVHGTSEQSVAIVPTRSGRIVLPELSLAWFNTSSGKTEYVRVPARTLDVKAAKVSLSDGSESAPIATANLSDTPVDTFNKVQTGSGLWMMVAAASLLTNVILVVLVLALWRRRSHGEVTAVNTAEKNSVGQYWKELNEACKTSDAARAHTALLAWANAGPLAATPVSSAVQMMHCYDAPELRLALQQLDATLFSASGNSAWNGSALPALLKKHKPVKKSDLQTSDRLYPA